MRLGFIFGFLIGALVASVKGETGVAEAPALVDAVAEASLEPETLVDKVKLQARLAVQAARVEADRKEAEMLREFEAAKQIHPA